MIWLHFNCSCTLRNWSSCPQLRGKPIGFSMATDVKNISRGFGITSTRHSSIVRQSKSRAVLGNCCRITLMQTTVESSQRPKSQGSMRVRRLTRESRSGCNRAREYDYCRPLSRLRNSQSHGAHTRDASQPVGIHMLALPGGVYDSADARPALWSIRLVRQSSGH